MFDETFQRFPGEIDSVEIGIAMLELGDEPERMRVVIEPAECTRGRVQCFLAGMAERCVSQIVRQRERFSEILVQRQHARD
jgi:hypothetical protein